MTDREIGLLDYLAIVWRRRWAIGAMTTLIVLTTAGALFRRARGIVERVSGQRANRLGPMPPERAWGLCVERIVAALDKER